MPSYVCSYIKLLLEIMVTKGSFGYILKQTMMINALRHLMCFNNQSMIKLDIILTMSFLRSKTINHYQLILPRENAHRIIEQLGRLENIEFKQNQKKQIQRHFQCQIKIAEETLQKIQIIQKIIQKQGLLQSKSHLEPQQYASFLQIADRRYRLARRSHSHLMQQIIQNINQIWDHYQRLKQRIQDLKIEHTKLREEMCILLAGRKLFADKLYQRDTQQLQMQFKCGVLFKKDQSIFKRTVFRITKGFCVFHMVQWAEIFPNTQGVQNKVVFYIFYGYGSSKVIQAKIMKLLDSYCITPYQYPKNEDKPKQIMTSIQQKILQNEKIRQLVKIQMQSVLKPFVTHIPSDAAYKFTNIEYYKLYFLHEKQIYQILNKIKSHNSFYEAEIFIQSSKIETVTVRLHQQLLGDQMPTPQFIPLSTNYKPTLYDLNAVTRSQYQILTAYGTPHYKEINPAVFNLITFPFLFGVMFGDIGHGAMLLAFGLLLIFSEHYRKMPMLSVLVSHRFMITLMGFFSLYCGIIYNEFLSMSLNVFGSCYTFVQNNKVILSDGCVYPLGIDPIWSISQNGLNFTNSLKMKIAVIIAVMHMTLGLFIKGLNLLYYGEKMIIIMQLIPQLIFLIIVFGYMDYLIVFKWLHQWNGDSPSIITTMINIPLQFGKTENCCGGQPMWGTYLNSSQNSIQLFILITSLLCIPVILFCSPLHTWLKNRKYKIQQNQFNLEEDLRSSYLSQKNEQNQPKNNLYSSKDRDFSQILVYQLIETIEFVLGCISNTASYLRLWALSLAHNQLSDVFFTETVVRGLQSDFLGIVYNLMLFPIFAALTFGILLCMDSMECFLHTLRLHWVEFQNKFYKGDGHEFESLNFLNSTNQWLEKHRQL